RDEHARRGRRPPQRQRRRALAHPGAREAALTPESRLAERGLELPPPPAAVGTYVGAVTVGALVFVSGHGPLDATGRPAFRGKLGREVDVATGRQAAQLTILNLLASLKAEIGE